MSIEKQINILLGDKIKMMELEDRQPAQGISRGDRGACSVKPVVEDEVKKSS